MGHDTRRRSSFRVALLFRYQSSSECPSLPPFRHMGTLASQKGKATGKMGSQWPIKNGTAINNLDRAERYSFLSNPPAITTSFAQLLRRPLFTGSITERGPPGSCTSHAGARPLRRRRRSSRHLYPPGARSAGCVHGPHAPCSMACTGRARFTAITVDQVVLRIHESWRRRMQ